MNTPTYNKAVDSKVWRTFPLSGNRRRNLRKTPVVILPGFKDQRPVKGEQEHPTAQ